MSSLSAFLHPVTTREEREIVISKRFVKRDENGNPVLDSEGKTIPEPFKIRSITQDEADAILKQSTRTIRTRNQTTETTVDNQDFNRRLVVAATMEPNFSATELCEAYGVMDPKLVPGKMLLSGEFSRLLGAILEISGLEESLEEEAKN